MVYPGVALSCRKACFTPIWAHRLMSELSRPHFTHTTFRRRLQFYGEQKGDTVFFGDKSTKKFGTYWVNDSKGEAPAPISAALGVCVQPCAGCRLAGFKAAWPTLACI